MAAFTLACEWIGYALPILMGFGSWCEHRRIRKEAARRWKDD
jgi:hypothetical protein